MSKSNKIETAVRSEFSPRVRDGLCRHIRSKGMYVNIAESPENDSTRRGYLAIDHNAFDWDGTVWWCTATSKTVGPDDRPCDNDRCKSGRRCFQGEDLVS